MLPRWCSCKESSCQCRRHAFDSWVGKIPWRRKWLPTLVFLPGKFHAQRSLVGYSSWVHKESDTTENADAHLSTGNALKSCFAIVGIFFSVIIVCILCGAITYLSWFIMFALLSSLNYMSFIRVIWKSVKISPHWPLLTEDTDDHLYITCICKVILKEDTGNSDNPTFKWEMTILSKYWTTSMSSGVKEKLFQMTSWLFTNMWFWNDA